MITIEFFGVPRLRAGTGRMTLQADTLATALTELARVCPALDGPVIDPGGGVLAAYRISLNGDRFVTDPATPLSDGDALILLAADVGG